jgi:thiamine-phosphate pyrophosphorylase
MDAGLVRWARAVKKRRRTDPLPVLWLFTDLKRLEDPLAAARRMPKGLCGIVLRHPDPAARRALAAALAPVCRARGIALVIAGDVALAAFHHAGHHLSRGRWPGVRRARGLVTASAHNSAEVRRAAKAGARIIFISPVYPTASHPGAPALGPARFAAAARHMPLYGLGGITGANVRRLGAKAGGAGAISAFE